MINEKYVYDIYNLKKKVKGKEKIMLSKYQELIPMYDIYSKNIYLIKKDNLHYRLIDCHYRFINEEIYEWLKLLYEKYTTIYKELKKKSLVSEEELQEAYEISKKFKKNLDIIDNYDISTLVETSQKTLYEYSKSLGLLISICKRNSFHPYIKYLTPYYTKLELIKLGQNMNIIDKIDPKLLLNREFHFNICKKVSKNDVSFEEINNHSLHIINNNSISNICYYSLYGSFLFNKYLRNNKSFNLVMYNDLIKIIDTIKTSPSLNNNYYIYRFIWDDSFLTNLNIGDYFIDNGFVSTTRDPFYSPGLNGNFGLVLIKINIPKNKKGVGLFIESFSLFQKEEEFLLPPYTKLKLISKDENFKYYHTNETFEKIIHKKYEFDYVDNDYSFIKNIKISNNFNLIKNLNNYEINGNDRITLFKTFINSNGNNIIINHNKKKYYAYLTWFDSSEESSYCKLYYNKTKYGLNIFFYENNYPYLNIEFGNEMVINYLNKFFYYETTKKEIDNDLLEIILEFGRIFSYKESKIFLCYRNFSFFDKSCVFAYNYMFNYSLYDFAKNNNKYLDLPFIKNAIGWYKYKTILSQKLNSKLEEKYNLSDKTIGEGLIHIIENDFNSYNSYIKEEGMEILLNDHLIYEIYEKLNNQNRIGNFRSDIINNEEEGFGVDFKLIFRQPIRRF